MVKWADHLAGLKASTAGDTPDGGTADAPVDEIDAAKAKALSLCVEGRKQQAVMTMCMAASRAGAVSQIHLDMLAVVGMDLAGRNDWSELEAWINGFS